MLRILDRYILRETLPLIFLSLLVFTFVLMIPPIMQVAEALIAKGVDSWTVAKLMFTLIPQGLGVTIPMAVLIGLLMGLGRMSTDREMVALQACGVGIYRLLRPVLFLASMAAIVTCYTLIEALPDANQAFRDITYRTLAARAEDEVKARVFDEGLPGLVLYVNEVDIQGTGWSNVFLADTRGNGPPQIYISQEGRILLDQDSRQVDILLTSGAFHQVEPTNAATYNINRFDEVVLRLDPDTIFPEGGPQRGLTEMRIGELQAQANEMETHGISPHNPIMEIHQKFSIPLACLVFALIALALGVTNRKEGKLASFALGIGVIFAYYIIMFGAKAMAKGALVSPHLAMWLPNIILGMVGIFLLLPKVRSTVQYLSSKTLVTGRTTSDSIEPLERNALAPTPSVSPYIAGLSQNAGFSGISLLSLLDRYVAKQYLKIVTLSFVGLLGIFYISTFVDLSDKLFKGETTAFSIIEYFWYATPQFIYYVLPISTLIATLITIGVLTKSSELTVMKACGVSLYRTSIPLLFFSLLWSSLLFGMGESFLADANRRANAIRHVIRGGSPETLDVLNRKWLVGQDGTFYHYGFFDPRRVELHGVTSYRFAPNEWRLSERTFANLAVFQSEWHGHDGWVQQFTADRNPGEFENFAERRLAMAQPSEFTTEQPDAERMNYQELDRYIGMLAESGIDVVPLRVELERKLSFPFVTLILTLIAVPFAVTTGRHGALYGVGIGIVLAISYWVVISIFSAIGSAGLLAPMLAAWAPNILFGGSAVYLLLAVRT